ncbi:Uncharacterised protein [Klebsiella quasipneumoniae]|nr:Uncharacterised protein [Klebsiella quasipneumoniae]
MLSKRKIMEYKYSFIGLVLPERAMLTFEFSLTLHLPSGHKGGFQCSIINNQLLAIASLEENIDLMTLRNIVHYIIQSNISLLGFYSGIFYDVKIDRVYNDELTVNYVYGVANTDIQEYWGELDIEKMYNEFKHKTVGQEGILLNRALNDLMSALRSADDAAFFCFRAIESLRNHNSLLKNIADKNDKQQWESFRNMTCCLRSQIDEVKIFADHLRHGKHVSMTADEVKHVLVTTWEIVRRYFKNI